MMLRNTRTAWGSVAKTFHWVIAALLALIAVHVAAALRHHFIKRNDILRRMWWGG